MVPSQGAVFRLAHISDLHFSSVPGRKGYMGPGLTKSILGFFEASSKLRNPFLPMTYHPLVAAGLADELLNLSETDALDAIVLTGDLATTGETVDLKTARDYIDGDLLCVMELQTRMTVPAIGQLACPLFVMPGNHDRYLSPACFPISRDFEHAEIFGSHWHLPNCKQGLGDSHSLVRMNRLNKSGQSLLLCRIDLSYVEQCDWPQTPLEYLGRGRVTNEVLEKIDQLTEEATKKWGDGSPILWAVHFPPVSDVDPSLELIERDLLLRKAADHGVTHILAGHTHATADHVTTVETSTGNPASIRVLTCGTSTGFEESEPQQFALREFTVQNGAITSVNSQIKCWDATKSAFV